MEIKRTEFAGHITAVSKIVTEVCGMPSNANVLRPTEDSGNVKLRIADLGSGELKTVTTDLGQTEPALPLSTTRTHLWLALHEIWGHAGKRKLRFRECAVRIYIGGFDQDPLQILRLEWVAPTVDPDGQQVYDGKHAGHPHWHVDRAALVGQDEYLRSLDALTAPETQAAVEYFTPAAAERLPRMVYDCSWLPRVHFPAHAGWMYREWDTSAVPAPHQTCPRSLQELNQWWSGSLRYLGSELPKAVA